jgi:hypothetical protein
MIFKKEYIMPPKTRITKEVILTKSFEIAQEEGVESLNVRYLAKKIECSTMPIFKVFSNVNELKVELKKAIEEYYDGFILNYIDKTDYLFTISFAYINFALKERKLFGALFVNEFIETRSMNEVICSSWNRETIECTANQYQISMEASEALYRDIRFYTHGIATQLYGGNIALSEDEIQALLRNAIEKFLR